MSAPHPFALFRVIHARTRNIRWNGPLLHRATLF